MTDRRINMEQRKSSFTVQMASKLGLSSGVTSNSGAPCKLLTMAPSHESQH